MLLQYASDLHIEFPENKRYITANPILPVGDVLVLAGDLVPFALIDKHNDFFAYLADNFEHTYWVPGNHEYYHSDAAAKTGSFCEKIRSNISLVNNWSLKTPDAHLIFSTLCIKEVVLVKLLLLSCLISLQICNLIFGYMDTITLTRQILK